MRTKKRLHHPKQISTDCKNIWDDGNRTWIKIKENKFKNNRKTKYAQISTVNQFSLTIQSHK